MRLIAVEPQQIAYVWPIVSAWIEAATSKTDGWWASEHVRAACEAGKSQLWVIWDGRSEHAAVITEIENGPAKTIGRIAILGGLKFDRWRHLLPEIEDWARKFGAVEMQICGRKGWKRLLARDGYAQKAVLLGKPL